MAPLSNITCSVNALSPTSPASKPSLTNRYKALRLRDENSPPVMRQSRIPSPSAPYSFTTPPARLSNIATPSQKTSTPTLRASSKLPRLAATLGSANESPIANRPSWMKTVATRVSSGRSSETLGKQNHAHKADTVTITGNTKRPPPDSLPKKMASTEKPLPSSFKPLPSRPALTMSGALSPTKDGRSIIDATERPLLKTTDQDQETAWPTLSPERSATASVETCLKVSTLTDLPIARTDRDSLATTSASIDTRSSGYSSCISAQSDNATESTPALLEMFIPMTEVAASCKAPPVADTENLQTQCPSRASSLQERTLSAQAVAAEISHPNKANGTAQHFTTRPPSPINERPHSPSPISFSQPRTKKSFNATTPTPIPAQARAKTAATASRIPFYGPKGAPHIVNIRKAPVLSPDSARQDSLSFGRLRIDASKDLETLVQDSPKRRMREQSRLQCNVTPKLLSGVTKETSFFSVELPRVPLPLSRSSSEPSDGSSTRSVRVKYISGNLLSGSFPGSTLTVSSDADDFLEMTSSENSASRYVSSDMGKGALPASGRCLSSMDEETRRHITSTLYLLEGSSSSDGACAFTNDEPSVPDAMADKDRHRHAVAYEDDKIFSAALMSEQERTNLSAEENNEIRDLEDLTSVTSTSNSSNEQMAMHSSRQAALRGAVSRKPSHSAPSYTLQTTASQRRRHPRPDDATSSSHAPAKDLTMTSTSIGFPSRAPSKASAILGPADATSWRSPSCQGKSSCASGAAPLTPPTSSSGYSHSRNAPRSAAMAPTVRSRPVRTTFLDENTSAKASRSRSKSRLVNNIKDLFSGKRQSKSSAVPPVPQIKHRHFLSPRKRRNETTAVPPIKRPVSSLMQESDVASHDKVESFRFPGLSAREGLQLGHEVDSIPSPESKEIHSMTSFATHIMAEAGKEKDMQKSERLLSLGLVMINTISSSKEAERSMIEAQSAADSAKTYSEMSQRGLVEIDRMLFSSDHPSLAVILRKLALRASG